MEIGVKIKGKCIRIWLISSLWFYPVEKGFIFTGLGLYAKNRSAQKANQCYDIEIALLAERTWESITTASPPFDVMANETDRYATSPGKVSWLKW